MKRNNFWGWVAFSWLGLVFFSSTSLAARLCDQAFCSGYRVFLNRPDPAASSFALAHFVAEKSVHLTLFFVLALLLWNALGASRLKVTVILTLGLLAGSASELLQRFFPGRDPSIRDVVINLASTALGIAVSAAFSQLRRRAHKEPDSIAPEPLEAGRLRA